MKVINISVLTDKIIRLGRRGEGNVRQIVFDCTCFAEAYGSGTAQLLHRRRGDEAPYPVLIEQNDNIVTWTVQESDTANVGIGEAEIIWMLPDGNAKSAVYETETLRSLSEPGDPPEPWQAWVDEVLKAAESGGATPEQIAGAVERYLAEHPIEETDPTVPEWAKQPEKPSYTASEVGADATGTAESKVSDHNTRTDTHNDIRILIESLTARLNALADSDDTTLDQMSEVVAYIKSNKSLIDVITTSKVNVSDIIDNLTTNASNKPLSAAQGVALKTMIDAIPTVELDESLTDNTKAAPAGMVGELKSEIDNIHIPEQIQSDWTQNDESAPDYIKNKPFYDNSWVLDTSNVLETNDINSDVGFVLISNNPDDSYLSDNNINYYGKYYYNTEYKLTTPYYTMYDCKAFHYTDDNGNETTICYVVRQENTSIDIYSAGTRYEISNPSIGIWVKHDPQSGKKASIYTKDVHKIDEKYLPDLAKHPDWNQDDETAVDFVKNRPILPISEIANYGVGFKINTALKAVIINLTKDSNADGLTFINNTQYLKIYLGFNKKQIGIFQWYYDGEISFTNNTSNKVISGQCNKDRFNITYDADGNIVNSNVYFKCFGNQVLLASVDQQEDEYKTPSQDTDPATKKYVDDSVADCIKTTSTAEVGQTIVVKTVDETGKPTEFEMESVADEMDALVSLSECGILIPVYQNGTFYTDGNGFIYTL